METGGNKAERLSRLLSFVLRHKPHEFEIELNEHGFVGLEDFVKAVSAKQSSWRDLTVEDVLDAVEASERPRFEVTGDMVRARYGHSIEVDLGYEPATPPEHLYHGGRGDRSDEIMSDGLRPLSRSYVHLSRDLDTAREVGRRRDYQPAIFRIRAAEAAEAGCEFFEATSEVWLTKNVPADFLDPVPAEDTAP